MNPNGEEPTTLRTRDDFARELTRLRERAGRSVRQVAKDADLPFSTVGGYFSGRHLPPLSQPQVLPKILAACGVVGGDEVQWWRDALIRLRRTGRTQPDPASPYRGLATFEPDDAEWFFGRTGQIRSLTARVEHKSAEGGVVAVVGASGSGKSSLLRAGLIPTLRRDWSIVLTSPAQERPELQADRPLLIVIDQFEELFSASGTETGREEYIDWVTGLPGPGVVVVLGLRADFFARALRYRRMHTVLREGQHLVSPMSREDVVQAVTGPADKAGVTVEGGLVDLLLRDLAPAGRDLGGNAGHEIGALPLLSHALMQTWRHDSRYALTIADYLAVGGIEGAIAATAERAYLALEPGQQALAKTVFLRMVHIGDGVADTRRRVGIDEFLGNADESDLALVLDVFVEQRLVTADRDTVEITHEALISAWPRLQSWLDEDRAGLLAHRRLTVAARQWESSGHDPALTLRGVPLVQAVALREAARFPLSNEERGFLDHSEELADEERRRRRRGVLRLRWLTAFLAVLFLVAAVLGIDATRQRGQTAAQRDLAVSRLLALRSSTLLPSDPALAGQLAVAAYRTADTTEARSAVLSTTRMPSVTRLLGPAGVVQAVVTIRDGEIIAATGTDGRIWLWRRDAEHHYRQLPQPATAPAGELYALAVDPGGHTLVAGGLAGVVHRWTLAGDGHLIELPPLPGPNAPIHGLDYSPDGATLAVGTTDHRVRLYTAAGTLRTTLEADTEVQAVRFSPDGRRLVAAGSGGAVLSWSTSGGTGNRPAGPTTRTFHSVAFSPDGTTIAAGNSDQSVYLWHAGDGSPGKTLTGGASWINTAEYSPDGRVVAAGNSDNAVRLWDVADGAVRASLPHPGPVTALRFADSGRTLVTAAGDGVVRVWQVPGPALLLSGEGVFSVAVGGKRILAGSSAADGSAQLAEVPASGTLRPIAQVTAKTGAGVLSGASSLTADGSFAAVGRADGAVELWDVRDPRAPRLVGAPSPPTGGTLQMIAFRGDGMMLAAAGDDQQVRLFDLRGPGTSRPIGVLTGPKAAVYGIAFNRDGTVMAGASVDKTVWLWDIHDPADPHVLSVINAHTNYAYSVSFSPTADLLVTASADKTIRLWDVSRPRTPVAAGPPLTGPGGPIITTAISADGRVLAAGGKDHLVWLWTITDPQHPTLSATPAATGDIYSLAFTDDGTSIVVGSADHLAALLTTDMTTAVARICDTAGASITNEEWATLAPGLPNNNPCSA